VVSRGIEASSDQHSTLSQLAASMQVIAPAMLRTFLKGATNRLATRFIGPAMSFTIPLDGYYLKVVSLE